MKMKNRFDDKIDPTTIYNGFQKINDELAVLSNKSNGIFSLTWKFYDIQPIKRITLNKHKLKISYDGENILEIYYNCTEEEYFQNSLLYDFSDLEYKNIKEAKEYYEYVKNNCYFIDEL